MSSTNRGTARVSADFYPTPAWCVARLLEALHLPAGLWLEPCAGNGAIIRAAQAVRPDITWAAAELRPAAAAHLRPLLGDSTWRLHIGDVRKAADFIDEQAPVGLMTNPPLNIATELMEFFVGAGRWVVLLLRLNFLSSARRCPFLRRHTPDVYVLPNRPSFTGGGKTDSIEYAWFVWPPASRRRGELVVLPDTPKETRSSSEPAVQVAPLRRARGPVQQSLRLLGGAV